MTDQNTFGYGQQDPSDTADAYSILSFVIEQHLGRIGTMKVVKVMKVTNTGDVSPVGSVDVQPLVNQVDGPGNAVPHGTVFGLAYLRLQGGTNGIIIDPKVGDIGIAVISDRDISAVKSKKGVANPGSGRRFAISDGVYIGGILGAAPNQSLRFNDTGVFLASPTKIEVAVGSAVVTLSPTSTVLAFGGGNITIDASGIHLNGPVIFNGQATGQSGTIDFGASALTTTGPITAQGIGVSTHVHPGVQPGEGTTGTPEG